MGDHASFVMAVLGDGREEMGVPLSNFFFIHVRWATVHAKWCNILCYISIVYISRNDYFVERVFHLAGGRPMGQFI